jgi:head-tail adaptor
METPLHLLDQTVTVNRAGHTARDAMGATVLTLTTAYSALPARVEFLSASESVQAGREATATTVRFFVPGTCTLTGADQIVLGGRTFRALGPPLNYGNANVLLEITAEESNP